MLESVQKFGLKVCLKQWHSTYGNLIDQAGIPSLAVRRKLLKLCQLYVLNRHVNFHNLPTSSRPIPYLLNAFIQFICCHFLNTFHILTFTLILSICHQFVEHST